MNILSVKSQAFCERIINMCKFLQDKIIDKKDNTGKNMINQISRSGTSIGANIAEGLFAQSRPDFVSKLYIALKETNETKHWLNCLYIGNYLTEQQYNSMLEDSKEIIKILVKTIKTTKENGLNAPNVAK
ncbi:MAG: four helix bundle protein [Prevotella sp.]|nr:four helix bundle protein [Prevotella sp.]